MVNFLGASGITNKAALSLMNVDTGFTAGQILSRIKGISAYSPAHQCRQKGPKVGQIADAQEPCPKEAAQYF